MTEPYKTKLSKNPDPIRIQKFLSQKGIFSRRETESLIRQQKIIVNDKVATLGDRVTDSDIIFANGKKLTWKKQIEEVVIAFYKPRFVESTLASSEEHETLQDFNFGGKRIFPVGRLDLESQGLLLLTNNGDLANKLMHPKYRKEKEYLVVTSKPFDDDFIKKMSSGVKISEKVTTQPCKVTRIQHDVFNIVLKEGKNRQIRKMAEELGYKVIDLLRVRIGKLQLGEMKPGKFRYLSAIEIKSLKNL
jgi:23S rRNA pseudouridine2604 synthase